MEGLGLPLALLAMGLFSGMHCVGMCGGIVAAFSSPRVMVRKEALWKRQLAFNGGRIATYSLVGALAGALGSAGAWAAQAASLQHYAMLLANAVVIAIGLQLTGLARPLSLVENLAAPAWRRVQPYAARASAGGNAWVAGMAWGLLPCGLVYAALAVAVLGGTPALGAAGMLAFGLGTLPWLVFAGLGVQRLRLWSARPALRIAAGSAVIGLGAWGLARAESVAQTLLCL